MIEKSLGEAQLSVKKGADCDIVEQARSHLCCSYSLQDEQVQELLVAASKTFAENLGKADDAVAQSDFVGLNDASHSLKGGLLTLGLEDFAELAKKIEQGAKSGEKLPYGQMLAELRLRLSEFL